jgi:hypothetical protein
MVRLIKGMKNETSPLYLPFILAFPDGLRGSSNACPD